MTLQRLPNGSVRIARLDEWHLDALRSIPQLADPGDDEKALRRVFPAPFAAGEATPEQQEDWVEYVQPDLQTLFEGSLERVAADLKTAQRSDPAEMDDEEDDEEEDDEEVEDGKDGEDDEEEEEEEDKIAIKAPEWEFTVPADHVEDWYRAMNQARLVLSSAKEAHRTDNDFVTRMLLSGELDVLVRYEMLTAMCGWWVEVMLRGK
jgi:hypothetical protein